MMIRGTILADNSVFKRPKVGIKRHRVSADFIKNLSSKSSGLERVFEALVKGLSITRVWVAILEKLGAIGGCLKEKLGSPENQEVAGAET